MLSLLKKSPDQAQAASAPAWHPNFRNFAELPDIKVVRTKFFVNGTMILMTAALALAFIYQEYKIADLERQVAEWQQQVNKDKKPSDQAVALFKKYLDQERKVLELNTYVKSARLTVSEFFKHLGDTLPRNIALTNIEIKEGGVTIYGMVSGAPESASGTASAYEKQLSSDQYITQYFDTPKLTSLVRDPGSGMMTLELNIKFKTVPTQKQKS